MEESEEKGLRGFKVLCEVTAVVSGGGEVNEAGRYSDGCWYVSDGES